MDGVISFDVRRFVKDDRWEFLFLVLYCTVVVFLFGFSVANPSLMNLGKAMNGIVVLSGAIILPRLLDFKANIIVFYLDGVRVQGILYEYSQISGIWCQEVKYREKGKTCSFFSLCMVLNELDGRRNKHIFYGKYKSSVEVQRIMEDLRERNTFTGAMNLDNSSGLSISDSSSWITIKDNYSTGIAVKRHRFSACLVSGRKKQIVVTAKAVFAFCLMQIFVFASVASIFNSVMSNNAAIHVIGICFSVLFMCISAFCWMFYIHSRVTIKSGHLLYGLRKICVQDICCFVRCIGRNGRHIAIVYNKPEEGMILLKAPLLNSVYDEARFNVFASKLSTKTNIPLKYSDELEFQPETIEYNTCERILSKFRGE